MNPAATVAATKVAENKATPYIILGVVVIGGGLAVYTTIKMLEFLQIKDTREEKREGRRAGKLTSEEAFDPAWAYNHPSKVTISQLEAEQLANSIYNASGYVKGDKGWTGSGSLFGWAYDDDEDMARGAIRQAKTSYNLSKVASVFYKKYKRGLLDFLQDFNGEAEMSKYYDIIDNYKS